MCVVSVSFFFFFFFLSLKLRECPPHLNCNRDRKILERAPFPNFSDRTVCNGCFPESENRNILVEISILNASRSGNHGQDTSYRSYMTCRVVKDIWRQVGMRMMPHCDSGNVSGTVVIKELS